MATILLVEDDHALAMGTQYALEAEGYTVLHAPDLAEARRLMNTDEENIDLILLDVMLPDGNGYDYCREIRRDNPQVPIIFLTAVSEEANIVQGLELGADDYVAKPYRVKELLSRIAANLRRVDIMKRSESGTRIAFGGHALDVADFRLYYHEQIVDITPGEFRLLKELVLHDGMVLTRNHLLEQLYDTGESFVDDNTLSVYIKRLRDALKEDSEWIETVRGVGYRFRKL
ncbi:MAG: response regulator transcription factor [Lachnospiraceae bacterium]|nr:response regulator transcription factor [Lachnospiraceae bacterium]